MKEHRLNGVIRALESGFCHIIIVNLHPQRAIKLPPHTNDALAIEQLLVTKAEIPVVRVGREDDGAHNVAAEGARVVPVLQTTVLGASAGDDVHDLHAIVRSHVGVPRTVHPGLHGDRVFHQMHHATGLCHGTEVLKQAAFHTWAATIKEEEHVPIIELPVTINGPIKAAPGSLQELAQQVRVQWGQTVPGPRVRLPKRRGGKNDRGIVHGLAFELPLGPTCASHSNRSSKIRHAAVHKLHV